MFVGPAAHQREAPVGRGVVDKHHMQRPQRLRGYGGERPPKEMLAIVYGDDYGKAHRLRSTEAWAAMPSTRPVKPRPSVVVAFTLTASVSMPRSAATLARMAST